MAALLPVLCLLPFLDKALNIDDPLFVWSAQHILSNPFDFYGFALNWYGAPDFMHNVNQNPPGTAYYLALFGGWWGWQEITLHAAMLLPAAAVGLGTYRLAQRLSPYPLTATLAGVLTPVFLVSASTLMSDVLMLAFYVWAVFCWVEGLERQRQWWLFTAALLIVAATLSKYFGATLIPLLGLYALLKTRRLGAWLAYLLFSAALLWGYESWVKTLYGHGLVSNAGQYLATYRDFKGWLSSNTTGLVFLGGCYFSLLFYAPRLWPSAVLRVAWLIGLLAVPTVLGLMLLKGQPDAGAAWQYLLSFVVFALIGLQIPLLAALEVWQRRSPEAWLLLCWVLGVFVFAATLNWTLNARTLLPMLPAVGILLARRLETLALVPQRQDYRWLLPPLLAGGVAMAVLQMDATWANQIRTTTVRLLDRYGKQAETLWFQGGWGFQYYMQQGGAHRVLRAQLPQLAPGTLLVVPLNNTNLVFYPDNPRFLVLDRWEVPNSTLGTTMHEHRAAGFYTQIWGELPFGLGLTQDNYLIYLIAAPHSPTTTHLDAPSP